MHNVQQWAVHFKCVSASVFEYIFLLNTILSVIINQNNLLINILLYL